MRQVVLDTETTGLEPEQGHRVIEIGCVELLHRRPSGERFHQYTRPDRGIDPGAVQVHGITDEFLADKPPFEEVVDDLLAFLRGAELVIHNAAFDLAFLDSELARLGGTRGRIEDHCTVLDTLALARRLHPGQRNSLDALCRRYGIDDSQRELHGALLDAEILAEVYLAMTGGQVTLDLGGGVGGDALGGSEPAVRLDAARPRLRVLRASAAELAAHEARLDAIEKLRGGTAVWRRQDDGGSG
jgi:DNA polymerase III subunit epsilon